MTLPQPTHREMVRAHRPPLKRGEMVVLLPGAMTPEDADPFIGARSPDGDWGVVAHLYLDADGSYFIHDLEVWSWDGSAIPLGTDVLRRLPLGRWATTSWDRLRKLIGDTPANDQMRRLARAKVVPSAGRRGYGEDYYRRIATGYLELQSKGVSRGIREALARQESRRQKREITPANVRDAISRATQMGFLSPGTPGRAGRKPGPNLYSDDERKATDGES